MNKIISFVIITFLPLILLSSCKKDLFQTVKSDNMQNRVIEWLNAQNAKAGTGAEERIASIKSHLDFTKMVVENIKPGRNLIIVPLTNGLITINNIGKKVSSFLLLKETTSGEILEGNIVQYMSEYKESNGRLPLKIFYNVYNDKKQDVDAKFSFLSISDRLIFEFDYKDGILHSFGITRAEKASVSVNTIPKDPIGPQPVCTDWYLVTTYYYPDGSTSQTEEYLYSTCQSGGSGGGDGNENQITSVVSQASWTVEAAGNWSVSSAENFTGIKNPNEIQGGHFTGITHQSSTMMSIGITTGTMKWEQTAATTNYTQTTATSIVSGWVSFTSMPQNSWASYVDHKAKNFFFNLLTWY